MTEVDYMTTMIKNLFLKKMPAYEFLDKYKMKNDTSVINVTDKIKFAMSLQANRVRVEQSLEDGDVDP